MFKAITVLLLSGCVASLCIGPAGIIIALIILPFIIFGGILEGHDQRKMIGRANGRRPAPQQTDQPADWDELAERLGDDDL